MTRGTLTRAGWLLLMALAALMLAAGCGDDDGDDGDDGGDDGGGSGSLSEYDLSGAEITVGSKDFTEQLILGNISLIALEEAGAEVEDQVGLAGTVAARDALLNGEIDTYWEYTGTGWITHLGNTDPIEDSQEQYEAVKDADLEENSIVWAEPAPFNNTYALAIRSEAYDELGVEKLSDFEQLLEESSEEATLCIESEFATRDDGLPGLEEHYGIEFPEDNITLVDTGVVYTETDKGETCNFGEVFTTDGRIAALDLEVVEDDKAFFPIYNPAWNIREEVADEHPEIVDLAEEVATALDTEEMTELNKRVDVDGEFPEDVAREWLEEEGLI